MSADEQKPVLILGAGINGCALARELVLNGVDVCLVDINDIAYGATSRSSRLIHGGLRYLEYGDVRLVRESLEERARLRALAPHFVKPLPLYIPVRRRASGIVRSILRFLGASRFGLLQKFSVPNRAATGRGLWLVRLGLWIYDWLAKDSAFGKSAVCSPADPNVPQVDANKYRWLCSYTDALMAAPERFVMALLEDARQLAQDQGTDFRVLPYHEARLKNGTAEIQRRADQATIAQFRPSAIVNATGAWGDLTLEGLSVPSRRLFGGTKGSHFLTGNRRLRQALGQGGVYAEAGDGRLVFVLPLENSVLVGTTDERFDESPERAVASRHELDYLLEMVNALFPAVDLTQSDVFAHYSGVRPLPQTVGGKTASIPRGHSIETHHIGDLPVLTLIGGKLTTCRAFAEELADRLFTQLEIDRTASSRDRVLPGGENYPAGDWALQDEWNRLANSFSLTVEQVRAVWSLCGRRAEAIFRELGDVSSENLSGTDIPLAYVRWVIEAEWVTRLDDLVERRLMLVMRANWSKECLRQLAACLVEAGRLTPQQSAAAIQATIERLREFYGKAVPESVASPVTA